MVGPGVAHKGVDGLGPANGPSSADGANASPQLVTATDAKNPGAWADHTDIRPTIMALVGLKDDYVDDGRVLTEDLDGLPGSDRRQEVPSHSPSVTSSSTPASGSSEPTCSLLTRPH